MSCFNSDDNVPDREDDKITDSITQLHQTQDLIIRIHELLKEVRLNPCRHCPRCELVIQSYGRNHIICPCKHEYCYKCGKAWKTCFCEQLDGIYTLVKKHVGGEMCYRASRDDAVVNQRVQQRCQCDHRRWANLEGRFICRECGQKTTEMRECKGCGMRECRPDGDEKFAGNGF